MTIGEMHKEFRLLLDKADSGSAPAFLSTEIDSFLNAAIERFITKRAFSNNSRGTGFEEDQKRRDDLRNIIKDYSVVPSATGDDNKDGGQFASLPVDYRHAISEECTLMDNITKKVAIKPLTYDRYTKVVDDPFNSVSSKVVYRLDFQGDKVELLSKVGVHKYYLRYLSVPTPVLSLENIEDPRYQSSKIELNEIE